MQKPLDIASTEIIDMEGFEDILNVLLSESRAWEALEKQSVILLPVDSNEVPFVDVHTEEVELDWDSMTYTERRYERTNPSRPRLCSTLTQAKDEEGNLVFSKTADLDAAFAKDETFLLHPSQCLPYGLRFSNDFFKLSEAECKALQGIANAYRKLDGAVPTSPEVYQPKMMGRDIGPDLDLLAPTTLEDKFETGLKGSELPLSAPKEPFQRPSNVLRTRNKRETRTFRDIMFVLGETSLILIIIVPVSWFYGGLHCAAWGFSFPGWWEEHLWKFSSLFITTICFSLVFAGWLFESDMYLWRVSLWFLATLYILF
ncbi:hypothetical protein PGQ11_002731 [Apiospora arundinis]|uniref:Uncharacterized protein n=1 Tax=Apiospora arundinis TaxID=335852 RepID=A0ABR2JJA8_9PEZI